MNSSVENEAESEPESDQNNVATNLVVLFRQLSDGEFVQGTLDAFRNNLRSIGLNPDSFPRMSQLKHELDAMVEEVKERLGSLGKSNVEEDN